MKKGTKKQANITRILTFFQEGDENEVVAVLMLMRDIIKRRGLTAANVIGVPTTAGRAPRRPRLNGAPTGGVSGASEVESHKERVAHALAQGE